MSSATAVAAGRDRIEWADAQMPVLRSIRERFAAERPLDGVAVGACLHVTAETANLVRTLVAGRRRGRAVRGQPAVHAGRRRRRARGRRGRGPRACAARTPTPTRRTSPPSLAPRAAGHARRRRRPGRAAARRRRGRRASACSAATEETTTGLVRLRALEADALLPGPRGQRGAHRARCSTTTTAPASRRSTASCAPPTCCSPGAPSSSSATAGPAAASRIARPRRRRAGDRLRGRPAARARGAHGGLRGDARARGAAPRGDVFVTVTGARGVLGAEHFERMKDGAVLANAGHFDVEIDLDALRAAARRRARRCCRSSSSTTSAAAG